MQRGWFRLWPISYNTIREKSSHCFSSVSSRTSVCSRVQGDGRRHRTGCTGRHCGNVPCAAGARGCSIEIREKEKENQHLSKNYASHDRPLLKCRNQQRQYCSQSMCHASIGAVPPTTFRFICVSAAMQHLPGDQARKEEIIAPYFLTARQVASEQPVLNSIREFRRCREMLVFPSCFESGTLNPTSLVLFAGLRGICVIQIAHRDGDQLTLE